MLTEDRKGVYLLRNFSIDNSLKKHTKQNFNTFVANGVEVTEGEISEFGRGFMEISPGDSGSSIAFVNGGVVRSDNWTRVWDGLPFQSERYYRNDFQKNWFKSKIWVKSLFFKGRQSPITYFVNVKNSIEQLENIDKKIEYLTKVEESLRISGQKNMMNVAIQQKKILQDEKILKEAGFKKFITEDNLVSFTLKCKRGLRLDYINEFNRIIPESVIKTRDIVEELRVFDNYVILHYDPNVKKVNLVEKKDPILFGLIKNSNKLYFVDEWIDEKCNLTYDKIIKELNIDEELS